MNNFRPYERWDRLPDRLVGDPLTGETVTGFRCKAHFHVGPRELPMREQETSGHSPPNWCEACWAWWFWGGGRFRRGSEGRPAALFEAMRQTG